MNDEQDRLEDEQKVAMASRDPDYPYALPGRPTPARPLP